MWSMWIANCSSYKMEQFGMADSLHLFAANFFLKKIRYGQCIASVHTKIAKVLCLRIYCEIGYFL